MNKEKFDASECVSKEGLAWRPRVPLFDNSHSATRGTTDEASIAGSEAKPCRDAEDMLIRAWRKALTQTALYKELALSGYRGNKSKEQLLRLGLACEVKLATNRRGRQKVLLQVTPRGLAYLNQLGVATGSRQHGRGGVRHRYYQNEVKQWYEKHGYVAEVEARVGNTSLDVLAICGDGTRIGIEIALSEQYEVVNALKAMGCGIERLLFVTESRAMIERLQHRIEAKLDAKHQGKVGYKVVEDYLNNE